MKNLLAFIKDIFITRVNDNTGEELIDELRQELFITKEGNIYHNYHKHEYEWHFCSITTVESELKTSFNNFHLGYNTDNIWEITAVTNDCGAPLDIPQPLTSESIAVFIRRCDDDGKVYVGLDINRSTPNPKRQAQAAFAQEITPSTPTQGVIPNPELPAQVVNPQDNLEQELSESSSQDTTSSQQKTSWFRFDISFMPSFALFIIFIFILFVLI